MQSNYVARHSLHKIGVGGLCIYGNCILFVKHIYGISKGKWTLPGGFLEMGETLTQSIEREVLEETGVNTRAKEMFVTRYMVNEKIGKGLISDLYIVFTLEYINGEPKADMTEISDAQFIPIAELDKHDISELSKYIVSMNLDKSKFNLLPYQPSTEIEETLNIKEYQLFG
ncbi:MAG: NUDIX domain-containing protein [Candidatus Thorarchaeota archaeon]